MDIQKYIAYACACAKKYCGVASRVGLDADDVFAEARLGLVEAASRWEAEKRDEGEFHPYLAAVVQGKVRLLLSRATGLNKHGASLRGRLVRFADTLSKRVGDLTNSDIAKAAEELGASEGTLRSAWERSVRRRNISLDAPVGDDADSASLGEMFHLPAKEVDGRMYYMTPEQLLIAREEAKVRNHFRQDPEVEHQSLHFWLGFIPKRHAQVLCHRYLYHGRRQPYPYRSICSKRYGGVAKSSGLAMSPEEAKATEAEAIAILRGFARGDFSGADFTEAVKSVPETTIREFMETLDDGAARMAVDYRLLKKFEVVHRSPDGTVKSVSVGKRPGLSVVARTWRKRLSAQAGRELSKGEAEEEIRHRFSDACRDLAVLAGITPAHPFVKEREEVCLA